MTRISLGFVVMIAAMGAVTGGAYSQEASEDTTLSASGDAVSGQNVFRKCQACHNPGASMTYKPGPNLDKIFGRMAGKAANYKGYSKALRESAIIWSETLLDQWLSNPQNFLPGNKMPFAGIRSAQDRADLMAYLREATEAGQ